MHKVMPTAFLQRRPVLKMLKLLLLVKLTYQILEEGKNIERSSQELLFHTDWILRISGISYQHFFLQLSFKEVDLVYRVHFSAISS